MANGPERERRKETRAGYGLQSENSDVYTDQQSCQSRHKNRLTACAQFHTKFTKGSPWTQCYGDLVYYNMQSSRRKKDETNVFAFLDFAGDSERVSCVPEIFGLLKLCAPD